MKGIDLFTSCHHLAVQVTLLFDQGRVEDVGDKREFGKLPLASQEM